MNTAQIIDACIEQINTDASRATILGLLQEAYDIQVAEARWFRTETPIGVTTSGTNEYEIPADLIEAYGVKVGNAPYQAIGEDLMWRITNATAMVRLSSGGGVFSQGVNATGVPTLTLYPTPGVNGTPITVYAARAPVTLIDSSTNFPATPRDLHSSLVSGTASLIYGRLEARPDLAAQFQASFESATERLRRRRNGILRGGAPGQLLVAGIHY